MPDASIVKRAAALTKTITPDTFSLLMVLTIGLAFAFPRLGAPDSILPLETLARLGVVAIFFMYGASLNPTALAAGVLNWRIHAITQASTFVLFPLIGVILFAFAKAFLTAPLALGFFFLAVLPSTISSSVALTGIARGNVPAAVFNATLSGLIGLVVTPALVALVLVTSAVSAEQINFPIADAIVQITMVLLAPFAAGQVLRPWVRPFLERHRRLTRSLDRGVILLIIFTSCSASVRDGVWWQFSLIELAITGIMVAFTLGLVLVIVINAARLAGLSREDEVTVVFCGATKSLVNGVPISQVLFAGMPGVGLLLLPLLLFHQLQLIVFGIMAKQYAEKAD